MASSGILHAGKAQLQQGPSRPGESRRAAGGDPLPAAGAELPRASAGNIFLRNRLADREEHAGDSLFASSPAEMAAAADAEGGARGLRDRGGGPPSSLTATQHPLRRTAASVSGGAGTTGLVNGIGARSGAAPSAATAAAAATSAASAAANAQTNGAQLRHLLEMRVGGASAAIPLSHRRQHAETEESLGARRRPSLKREFRDDYLFHPSGAALPTHMQQPLRKTRRVIDTPEPVLDTPLDPALSRTTAATASTPLIAAGEGGRPTAGEVQRYRTMFSTKMFYFDISDADLHSEMTELMRLVEGRVAREFDVRTVNILISEHVLKQASPARDEPAASGKGGSAFNTPAPDEGLPKADVNAVPAASRNQLQLARKNQIKVGSVPRFRQCVNAALGLRPNAPLSRVMRYAEYHRCAPTEAEDRLLAIAETDSRAAATKATRPTAEPAAAPAQTAPRDAAAAADGGAQQDAAAPVRKEVTAAPFAGETFWMYMGPQLRALYKDYSLVKEQPPQIYKSGIHHGYGPFYECVGRLRTPEPVKIRAPENELVIPDGRADEDQQQQQQQRRQRRGGRALPKSRGGALEDEGYAVDDETETAMEGIVTRQRKRTRQGLAGRADGKSFGAAGVAEEADGDDEGGVAGKGEDGRQRKPRTLSAGDAAAVVEDPPVAASSLSEEDGDGAEIDTSILFDREKARAIGYKPPGFLVREGYCEPCRVRFERYEEHVHTSEHRAFAENTENYVKIDALRNVLHDMIAAKAEPGLVDNMGAREP